MDKNCHCNSKCMAVTFTENIFHSCKNEIRKYSIPKLLENVVVEVVKSYAVFTYLHALEVLNPVTILVS